MGKGVDNIGIMLITWYIHIALKSFLQKNILVNPWCNIVIYKPVFDKKKTSST